MVLDYLMPISLPPNPTDTFVVLESQNPSIDAAAPLNIRRCWGTEIVIVSVGFSVFAKKIKIATGQKDFAVLFIASHSLFTTQTYEQLNQTT